MPEAHYRALSWAASSASIAAAEHALVAVAKLAFDELRFSTTVETLTPLAFLVFSCGSRRIDDHIHNGVGVREKDDV